MEMDNQPTAGSSTAHVGAGAPTCPAERSSANVASAAHFAMSPNSGELRSPARTRASGPTCDRIASRCLPLPALYKPKPGKTVRHHKVAVDDPSSPPELIQAEARSRSRTYATAEPLLKKVVAQDPENYAAWFDLGFLYNAPGQDRRIHRRLSQVRRCQAGRFRIQSESRSDAGEGGPARCRTVSARRHQAETNSARCRGPGPRMAVPGPRA